MYVCPERTLMGRLPCARHSVGTGKTSALVNDTREEPRPPRPTLGGARRRPCTQICKGHTRAHHACPSGAHAHAPAWRHPLRSGTSSPASPLTMTSAIPRRRADVARGGIGIPSLLPPRVTHGDRASAPSTASAENTFFYCSEWHLNSFSYYYARDGLDWAAITCPLLCKVTEIRPGRGPPAPPPPRLPDRRREPRVAKPCPGSGSPVRAPGASASASAQCGGKG